MTKISKNQSHHSNQWPIFTEKTKTSANEKQKNVCRVLIA